MHLCINLVCVCKSTCTQVDVSSHTCIHASVFMHVFCNRDREGGEATAGHSFTPSMDASPPHFSRNSWSCHRSDTPPSAYSYLGGSKKRVGEERGRAKLSESNCINVKSICMQKKNIWRPTFQRNKKNTEN